MEFLRTLDEFAFNAKLHLDRYYNAKTHILALYEAIWFCIILPIQFISYLIIFVGLLNVAELLPQQYILPYAVLLLLVGFLPRHLFYYPSLSYKERRR